MTLDVGGTHDVVLGHQLVLFHNTEDIASTNDIALLEVQGVVQPLLLARLIDRRGVKDTYRENEHRRPWGCMETRPCCR